jgi:ABC-type multidrug transport system fused ATPase/permease subunit
VSALLELDDVHLARAGRAVLRGLSASAAAGAVTALLGPSGAGKSTALRCLVRLEEPELGRVLVDGADVREQDPLALRRRVGLVTQAPVMLPGTVADNLRYATPAALEDDALHTALRRSGLSADFAQRDASALSGGERARVAIARALTRDPQALLFDEPTAALDPARAAEIETLAVELAGEGLAVVLTTHDVALVRRAADRAVLIAEGRAVCAGAPGEVLDAWEAEPAWR